MTVTFCGEGASGTVSKSVRVGPVARMAVTWMLSRKKLGAIVAASTP